MPLDVLLGVDDDARQVLLVRLPLEDCGDGHEVRDGGDGQRRRRWSGFRVVREDALFSSTVPVATKRYTKPVSIATKTSQLICRSTGRAKADKGGDDAQSFFCPSRHTRASACMSLAGFQSARR